MYSKSNNNLVSIIMPCYNASQTVGQSIESVLSQSYENWELVITNDCSSDNTMEVLEQYALRDTRIKVFSLEYNQGVAAARNNSISKAQGDYIAFLDSDDLWLCEKLTRQMQFMVLNNYLFSYSAYQKITDDKGSVSKPINVSTKGVDYRSLLKHNEIGCLTVIVKKSLLKGKKMVKVGHEDYVLWLSILKDGNIAYGLNEVLASYRVGNESISSNKLKAAGFTWNIYRNVEKLGLIESAYYFCNYAICAVRKYLK